MNETDLRIQNPQNYFLGIFDVSIFLKRSERHFAAFLLSVLSALETVSELMEIFIVLASSCLLHFKVPAVVLIFKKCYKIVKESDQKARLPCC